MLMPSTPADLGAPSQFVRWRPHQREALDVALGGWTRFIGISAGTGLGKSVCAFLAAHMLTKDGGRAVILTSRIGLGAQYASAFPELAEIHGRRNYRWEADYDEAVAAAQEARIVVTNYAYWLYAQNEGNDRLGQFDVMVCDEAVEAFSDLSNYYSIKIEQKKWYELTREDLPEYGPDELKEWAAWARKSAVQIDDWRKHYGKRTDADKFETDDEYVLLRYSLNRVGRMSGEWICDRTDSERNGPGVLLAKVWPGEEAERVLFRGIPHVVLMSATLRPRSLELLGIPPADFHFAEFPHPFPWSIRPVYWVPTIRALQRTATEDHWRFWSTRIDQLIDRGTAGRGMVHCVSYDRCRMFLGQSRHRGERGLLWTHTSRNLPKVLEDFKTAAPPVVLVSPSIISGFDLPQVSYQVIGKVPFVAGDKLHKAREATDPTWQWYGLGQTIVQQAGRIARSGDGPAKPTFIIDDSISWVMPKCRGLIPEWFRIEKTERIPDWGGAE